MPAAASHDRVPPFRALSLLSLLLLFTVPSPPPHSLRAYIRQGTDRPCVGFVCAWGGRRDPSILSSSSSSSSSCRLLLSRGRHLKVAIWERMLALLALRNHCLEILPQKVVAALSPLPLPHMSWSSGLSPASLPLLITQSRRPLS